MKQISDGIYKLGRDYATKSIAPKQKVYDERVIRKAGNEFRIWNPRKSKLSAALHKGLKNIPLKRNMKILYLGIANGTTASHLSDLISENGIIYGIEFSSRPIRDLIFVSEKRKNIIPILDDARLPQNYANKIEKVDLVYCDIAQKDQSEILIRNANIFLKKKGFIMIAIKARSIDVSRKPREIFEEQKRILEKRFNILQQINLEPFEKDHCMFVGNRAFLS